MANKDGHGDGSLGWAGRWPIRMAMKIVFLTGQVVGQLGWPSKGFSWMDRQMVNYDGHANGFSWMDRQMANYDGHTNGSLGCTDRWPFRMTMKMVLLEWQVDDQLGWPCKWCSWMGRQMVNQDGHANDSLGWAGKWPITLAMQMVIWMAGR